MHHGREVAEVKQHTLSITQNMPIVSQEGKCTLNAIMLMNI